MKLTELSDQLLPIIETFDIGKEYFWEPLRLVRPGAWTGHLATAFWLVKVVRPVNFVELGTHSGNSYSAFCQAISQFGLSSRAFAVDTWTGDEQSGSYDESVFEDLDAFNRSHFNNFSRLVRATFDEAREFFAEGSIDLLHIDGLHTYDAVKHDFETWKSAASRNAVVVFHDTNVRKPGFGVWKLWQELSQIHPSFEFYHSEGLGILSLGTTPCSELSHLFELGRDSQSALTVRQLFAARGESFLSRAHCLDLEYLVSVHSEKASEAEASRSLAANLQDQLDAAKVELDRLRKVEDRAREQAATFTRLSAEAEGYRLASEGSQAARENLQFELKASQDELAALREENSRLVAECNRTGDELSAVQLQMQAAQSLTRQQCTISQRSVIELLAVRQELDRYKQELLTVQQERDRYKAAHQEALGLLIPWRVRGAVPESLKRPVRAIKRALRSLT